MYREELRFIFSVKISRQKTVADPKKAIKTRRPVLFEDVDANSLFLYKASIDCSDGYDNMKGWTEHGNEPLRPGDSLRQVFADFPLKKHIHIIVQEPTGRSFRSHSRVGL